MSGFMMRQVLWIETKTTGLGKTNATTPGQWCSNASLTLDRR
jgi:hypothetical protein